MSTLKGSARRWLRSVAPWLVAGCAVFFQVSALADDNGVRIPLPLVQIDYDARIVGDESFDYGSAVIRTAIGNGVIIDIGEHRLRLRVDSENNVDYTAGLEIISVKNPPSDSPLGLPITYRGRFGQPEVITSKAGGLNLKFEVTVTQVYGELDSDKSRTQAGLAITTVVALIVAGLMLFRILRGRRNSQPSAAAPGCEVPAGPVPFRDFASVGIVVRSDTARLGQPNPEI